MACDVVYIVVHRMTSEKGKLLLTKRIRVDDSSKRRKFQVLSISMGKRYYCDFCDKSFADSPQNRKNHMSGGQHQRMRKAHYDSFRGKTKTGHLAYKKRLHHTCIYDLLQSSIDS